MDTITQTHVTADLAENTLLHTVLNAGPVPMFLYDAQGFILFLNRAFVQILGYTKDDLLTVADWWNHAYPDPEQRQWELDLWQTHLEKAQHSGAIFSPVDLTVTSKNGTLKNLVASVNFLDAPAIDICLMVLHDVTEQVTLREQQRQSAHRFRELFTNMNNGAVVYDAVENGQDFIFKDFNAAAERIDQVHRKDLLGRKVTEAFPGIEAMGLLAVFRRVWHSGIPEHHDLSFYQDHRITGWRENFVYRLISGELVVIYEDVTAQKQAEAVLREGAKKYHAVIETTIDGFWVANLQGRFIEVNNAYLHQSGYSRDEFLTMGIADVEVQESSEQAIAHIRKIIDTGRDLFETQHRVKDGSTWPVEVAAAYWPGEGFFVFVRNITERKRVQEALRKSEARYRTLYELSRDGIVRTDMNGRFVDFNPSFLTMVGYSADELMSHSHKMITPVKWETKEDRIVHQQIMGRGYSDLYQKEYLRKGGLIITVEIRSFLIQKNGQNKGMWAVVRDISERKRAETELNIAAAAFESQEGIVVTDAQGVILRVNRAFSTATGYAAGDVVGRTPQLLKSGRHDESFYAMIWASIQDVGEWQGEIWNRRQNGEVYPAWLTITAVKNDYETTTHYVGVLTDITQRKAAEDEIKHLAFYDPLTHLPNRRLLIDRLKQALITSVRHQRQGALLFIDLDNFKTLNDTFGHDQGDLLLQQVAERLAASVRKSDTVARLGGYEFVVMLEDLSTALDEAVVQVDMVSRKILAALNQPYALPAGAHYSTPSIGITLFGSAENSVENVLKQADIAMYQAKAAGRNTLCFFNSASMQKG